jgi:RNA exonuclease 1
MTTAGSEVARISLVDENNATVLDEFIVPDNEIVDYLTQYSGITAKRIEGVTTKLTDIQKKLQELITYDTILVGHALENDMKVLKVCIHR